MKTSLALFLVLQALDVLTTVAMFVRFSDPMIEANPVARAALVNFGWTGMVGLKLLGLGVVGVIWWRLERPWRVRLLDLGVGVMLGVVVGNLLVLTQC